MVGSNSENKINILELILIKINNQVNKSMEEVTVLPYRRIPINKCRKKERKKLPLEQHSLLCRQDPLINAEISG